MKIRNYVLAGSLGFAVAVGIAAGPGRGPAPVAAPAPVLAEGQFAVDTVHSATIFKITHNGAGTFLGRFNELSGTFSLDATKPESGSLNFTIKTESVDTANGDRDKHLRGADFFNTKQFPESTFKSKSIKKAGEGFEVTGDLTLCGVTKPVVVKITNFKAGVNAMNKKPVAGFEANFTIKRADFGITKFPGMLGDDVAMTVGVEGGGE